MGDFISYELLPIVFNMSVTASVAILFVLLARLLLKRAPKIFSYALWAVVLFRLLCPVSITTGFSLLGLFDAPVTKATAHTSVVEYVPQDVVHTRDPEVQLPVPAISQTVNEALPQGDEQTAADPLKAPVALATLVWLAGIGVLAAYSVVSLLRLRRKLMGAVPLRENIYLADYIVSPFVMGIFHPKIYLPSSLTEQERGYILLHEQHHIRRGDHIVKALAFLALCVHWFNPLVWVAFVLSAKDMEMSCDEAVVRKLGEGIRADYSASLLSLATGRRIIAGTPLAFGEGDTKSRIKNMLNWKKAKPTVVFLAATAVIMSTLVCATNQRDFTRAAEEDAAAYLHRLKGAYHWDKKRIEQMVPALETDELGTYTFYGIYRSEGGLFPKKCYELTLKFANEPEQESAFNEEMEHRAAILLGLVGNLEQVTWEYPLNDDTMTAACFYSMLNQPVEALGNETIEELCKTEDGLRALLEHWGLSESPTAEETLQIQLLTEYGIPKDISDFLISFLDTCKNNPENAVAYCHFEQESERDAYVLSNKLVLDYEILDAEELSEHLYAFKLHLTKEGQNRPERFYFVGEIDGQFYLMNNIYNVPRSLRSDLDEAEITRYANGILPPVGEAQSPEELETLYTKGESFTEDGRLVGSGQLFQATESGLAADGAGEPLTAEELAWFNDWLEPIVQDKQGNDIGVNPRCCFLTSYYDDVTELNFEEFMRYFPGDGSQTSEAEFEALKKVDGWPFAHVNSLTEMMVPVHKYPRRLVDLILSEYAGVSTADLNTEGVAYLPEYDAYYNYTSDAGCGTFYCTCGEKDGDLIRLYDESYGVKLLTLRQVGSKTYQIVSHQLLESPAG